MGIALAEVHMLRLGVATILATAATAAAAPPEGADPNSPTGQWFQSLVREDGISCCAVSDCRPANPEDLRFSESGSGLEVNIESHWETVDEGKIERREDNPLGRSIICKSHQ